MMEDLKVALVQTDLHWENPEANRAEIEEQLVSIGDSIDLLILPETFTTGFSMKPEIAEIHNLHTTKWMKQIASMYQCVVAGSVLVKDGQQYVNRLYVVNRKGMVDFYDKRHLFAYAGEDQVLTKGQKKTIIDIKGWKINFMICYDLRFPVWSRNKESETDVYVYVANWPAQRKQAWTTLLSARSIENLAYTIGVNRTGEDGNGINYQGASGIYFPDGSCELDAKDTSGIYIGTLYAEKLISFRKQFPFDRDADKFELF